MGTRSEVKSNIHKIALALIRNNELLLVRNRDTTHFLMPGGGVEIGEGPLETLAREITEELRCKLITRSIKFLGDFEDWAANHHGRRVNIKLYSGEIEGQIKPDNEIDEIMWWNPACGSKECLSSIVRNHIVPFLIKNKVLKVKK